MKKHVLLGLTLMLFCFITGGFYIVSSIQSSSEKLQRVVELNQVKLMRSTLEHNIEAVQTNLLLQGSPHINAETTLQQLQELKDSATVCSSCHHSAATKTKLDSLQQHLAEYVGQYQRTLTNRDTRPRRGHISNLAYSNGENLRREIHALSLASAEKISNRIDIIHAEIRSANRLLMACLVLGPIAILIITLFFLRRFTGSINTLVAAAEKLAVGNLDYKIETPLKDEFKTLADSFNSMVDSLNAERSRSESMHALYQTLFESAGDAICIIDTGERLGQIVSVNPATCSMYGYSNEELQGMSCLTLSPPEEKEIFERKMQEIMQGGLTHCTVTRIRKDGSQFTADISAGPLVVGAKHYILTFTRDITEQHQAEQELQRANQMALVGQMAAGLAHEIKNPLAGIKVSLDVLADEMELPDGDKEIFARIINEIDRMERLLKSLLNYARPPVPHFDLTDINLLIDHSVKNVAVTTSKSTENRVEFACQLDPDLRQIEADTTQLQQVLLNLYLNAIDAMPQGGCIRSETRLLGEDQVQIEISDTGKGIPEVALAKVFTPFYTTKTKGNGLGLAICKRLIEQHQGRIDVTSTLGEGTRFTITLPLAQKHRELS